jgi:predicted metal-binding protein
MISITPRLTICADCERQALRGPWQGQAITEALACLTRLLLKRKRLEGLEIVRESCLQNCPLGRICVALQRGDQAVRHHLDANDDLRKVAAKLVSTKSSRVGQAGTD